MPSVEKSSRRKNFQAGEMSGDGLKNKDVAELESELRKLEWQYKELAGKENRTDGDLQDMRGLSEKITALRAEIRQSDKRRRIAAA